MGGFIVNTAPADMTSGSEPVSIHADGLDVFRADAAATAGDVAHGAIRRLRQI